MSMARTRLESKKGLTAFSQIFNRDDMDNFLADIIELGRLLGDPGKMGLQQSR